MDKDDLLAAGLIAAAGVGVYIVVKAFGGFKKGKKLRDRDFDDEEDIFSGGDEDYDDMCAVCGVHKATKHCSASGCEKPLCKFCSSGGMCCDCWEEDQLIMYGGDD